MCNSIVLDTNIFIETCRGQENYFECSSVLSKLTDGIIKLAVDTDGEILKEYIKKLNENMKYPTAKLFLELLNKERFKITGPTKIKSYFPMNLSRVQPLIDMGFDQNDIKFVRIANQSDLKTIISIDSRSFFLDLYASWIRDQIDVETMRPCTFNAFFQI
jgi:predicted nucleic acid-binding protein